MSGDGATISGVVSAELPPGVYIVTMYTAYSSKGDAAARSSSSGDWIKFKQPSRCGVFAWTTLDQTVLARCGGNQEKEKDLPQSAVSVRDVQPAL